MINHYKEFIKNVTSVINKPEMKVLPGQLAFFFVLSIVPIVTLITYVASFLNLPMDFIADFVSTSFGNDVASLIIPTVVKPNVNFSFFFTLFIGFYVASNGATSIITASNAIYGIKDGDFLKRKIKAIILTIIIVILFIFILIIPVFGKNIVDIIELLNLNSSITKTIFFTFNLLKGPVTWLIMFLFIKIIYTMAPDRNFSSSNVNYGAVFTTVMWIIVTAIYSFYINNFANYSLFYGALSNIVMLMLWIYFLATIFVIGMALNYRKETILEKTGAIKILKK